MSNYTIVCETGGKKTSRCGAKDLARCHWYRGEEAMKMIRKGWGNTGQDMGEAIFGRG